jgi:hypothetical protein
MGDTDDSAPVDGRVEGAIESLNTAIAQLNTLEDTRTAAAAAAGRAAALVRSELGELDSAHASLRARALPFLEARKAASDAIEAARAAEAEVHATSAVEAEARNTLAAVRHEKLAKLAANQAVAFAHGEVCGGVPGGPAVFMSGCVYISPPAPPRARRSSGRGPRRDGSVALPRPERCASGSLGRRSSARAS